jgi:hypothetical protein
MIAIETQTLSSLTVFSSHTHSSLSTVCQHFVIITNTSSSSSLIPSFHLPVDNRSNSLDALSHSGKVKNYLQVVRKEIFFKKIGKILRIWHPGPHFAWHRDRASQNHKTGAVPGKPGQLGSLDLWHPVISHNHIAVSDEKYWPYFPQELRSICSRCHDVRCKRQSRGVKVVLHN